MKKNFTKKVLAAATAATLLVSSIPTAAFASSTGSVALTAAVVAPKYTIGVPKTLAISINPLLIGVDEADYTTAGITSNAVAFTNLSNLPVTIDISLIPKMAANTTLVDSTAADDLPLESSKQAYMFVEFAKVVKAGATGTSSPKATEVDLAEAAVTWGGTTDGIAEFEATDATDNITTSLDFQLILSAAVFTNATDAAAASLQGGATSPTTGAAVFRFGGQVSGDADWKAADFGMNLVFDAKAVSNAAATALLPLGDNALTALGTATGLAFERAKGLSSRQIMFPATKTVTLTELASGGTISAVAFAKDLTGVAASPVIPAGIKSITVNGANIVIEADAATAFKTTIATFVKVTFDDSTFVVYPLTIIPAI